ncbi:hypothetical protein [Rummeliibacillus pycnus]|uniref:hypothetical protein n=1 Tax=Rummeliibacillus pycnus TaxID=101070 RepID=UPI0037CB1075
MDTIGAAKNIKHILFLHDVLFSTAAVAGVITAGFGAWILGLVFSFIYNNLYIKALIEKGYGPINDEDQSILQQNQILSK